MDEEGGMYSLKRLCTPMHFPSFDESSCSMDDSMHSSGASTWSQSVSINTTTTIVELEEMFQRAMNVDSSDLVLSTEVEDIAQEELDALYAREMWVLTGKEREDVLHDLHGVADRMEETSEFCEQKVQLLQKELQLLMASRPPRATEAYLLAVQQNEAYVKSLQLMFLRADRWKPREAAERIIGFFENKMALFGSNALTEQITIERHMSKEDRQALESGFFQLLSVRDTAGRAIIMGIPPLRNYKHPDNLKRAFFYIVMTALEDLETQKVGIVMVGFNMGSKRAVDSKAAFVVQSLKRFLPFRLGSIHYCYDDIRFRVMMTLTMLMMGAMRRVRFRAHFGNHMDVVYKLSTFGVPCSALPIAADGEPKVKNHKSWLKLRNVQEKKQAMGLLSQSIVVIPNRLDILLGRGKPIQEHFGNLWYHSLLDCYQDAYDRSMKFQKMKISQKVMDTVAEYGGRFLKQEGAGWVVVDATSTREKVGHAFRTRRAAATGNGSLGSNALSDAVTLFPIAKPSSGGHPMMKTIPDQMTSPERMTTAILVNDAERDTLEGRPTGSNGKRRRLWEEIFPE